MANALPKGVKAPKFSDKPKEEKKPTPVEEPKKTVAPKEEAKKEVAPKEEAKKVEAPIEETKKEEKPVEEKETKKEAAPEAPKGEAVPDSTNILIPNQPMLKGGRILFPYIMAFLYNLILIVALVGFLAIPMIRNDRFFSTVCVFGTEQNTTFTASLIPSLGTTFAETYSILDAVMYYLSPLLNGDMANFTSNLLTNISQLWGILLIALPLLVLVIWFVIKFIHSLIALITCIGRKHQVIDGFYYKNTHQYYSLGILDFDFTFIVLLIYVIWYLAIMIAVPFIVGTVGASLPFAIDDVLGSFNFLFDGIVETTAATATEAAVYSFDFQAALNLGAIVYLCVLGAFILIRIIYRISVGGLSRKVKKTYVRKINYKKLKKAAKKGELV